MKSYRFLILLAAAVILSAGMAFPAEEALFRFVHMTDLHFVDSGRLATKEWQEKSEKGTRDFQKGPSDIKNLVSWCNGQNVNFVVMTGDILENINYKESMPEFSSLFEGLKAPYFIIPGNHDFGLEKFIETKRGGVDFYFTAGGLVFAGIQTHNDMFTGMVHLLKKDSLEKLVSLLTENKERPTVVLTHSSVYGSNEVPDWALPSNAKQAREVFEKPGNVFAVLAGHIHIYTESFKNGITYITGPGLVEKPFYPFILWTVFPDKIEGRFFAVGDDSVSEIHKVFVNSYPNRAVPVKGAAEPVLIKIPERLRAGIGKIKPGDLQAKPIPSAEGLLEKVFGENWSYYPGGEPVAWENETIVLPKNSSGWKYLKKSGKEKMDADVNGKKWYEEGFVSENWEEGRLPASYKYRRNKTARVEVKTELPDTGSDYYWRLTFDMPPGLSEKPVQKAMLRVASDKFAVVYLNGKIIDEDTLGHWADYWNRYVVFESSMLKEKDNVLAVKLANPYVSSHSYLDVEIAVLNPGGGK